MKQLENGTGKGHRPIKVNRLPSKEVSRLQRVAVLGEVFGPSGDTKNKKQRKAIGNG